MDDRIWYLAVGVLSLGLIALLADIAVPGYTIPGPLWGFLTAVMGFLGGIAAIRSRDRGDGKGNGANA